MHIDLAAQLATARTFFTTIRTHNTFPSIDILTLLAVIIAYLVANIVTAHHTGEFFGYQAVATLRAGPTAQWVAALPTALVKALLA